MLEKFLYLEKPLSNILANPPNTLRDLKLPTLQLSPGEWKKAEELQNIFTIYQPAVETLSGHSYPTLRGVLPAYIKLGSDLLQERDKYKNRPNSKPLVEALEAGIEKLYKYFDRAKASESAVIATILNPYYKLSKLHSMGWTSEELEHCKAIFLKVYDLYCKAYNGPQEQEENDGGFISEEEVYYGVERIASTPEPKDGRIFNAAEQYLYSKPLKKHKDPSLDIKYSNFWRHHESPILARMARDYGSILATSVPSESVFSIAGLILTKRRNRLVPATMEILMCLKSWGLLDDMLITAAEVDEEKAIELDIGEEEDKKALEVEEKGYDMTRKGDADIIIV